MTDSLHCNWLKCRKSLLVEGKAVVTTCSHIFCVTCAEQLFTAEKQCPACKTTLKRPDDVVLSSLNPTLDYRTSVLAGLSPSIAVDILARSLAFWQYQQSQELAYHTMLLNTAQERTHELETRLETVLSEANQEIQMLQKKEADLQMTCQELQRANADMSKLLHNKRVELESKCQEIEKQNVDLRKLQARRSTPRQAASPLGVRPSSSVRNGQSESLNGAASAAVKCKPPESGSPALLWQMPSRPFMSTLKTESLMRSPMQEQLAITSASGLTKVDRQLDREDDNMRPRKQPSQHFKNEPHPFLNTEWQSSTNLNRFTPSQEHTAAAALEGVGSTSSGQAQSYSTVINRPNSVLGHLSGRPHHASRSSLDRGISTSGANSASPSNGK